MNIKYLILSILIALAVLSCKKEEEQNDIVLQLDSELVVQELKEQLVLNEVDEVAKKIESYIELDYSLVQINDEFNCATVTVDTLVADSIGTDTLFFNIEYTFGACTPNFGSAKTGQIKIYRTGDFYGGLYYHKLITENFSVDTIGVNITQTLNLVGFAADSSRVYEKNSSSTLQYINQSTVARLELYRLTWLNGIETINDSADDEWIIEGQSEGITGEGIGFQKIITTPLLLVGNCKYYKSGVIELTPEGRVKRVMSFTDENCVGKLTAEVGNLQEEILLKEEL